MKRQVAIGLILLGTSAVTQAADAVPLRANLTPGKAWKFNETQTSDSKNTATMNGQSQDFASKSTQRRSGTIEVLAVSNGVPSSVRVTFDKECASTGEMNGQSQTTPYPYAGQTITITRSPDGKVTDDFQGQVDPTMSGEIHAVLDRDAVLMPNKLVAVGDEWPADPAVAGRVLQLVGQDSGGMTLKLLGVKQVDGKDVAEVKISFVVEKGMGPMQAKLIMQGVDTVDLATGHVIKSEIKGTADVTGKQQANGPDGAPSTIEVQGKGTVAIVGTSPLTDSNNAGAFNPFAPASTPTPVSPAGPTGGNPLSPTPSFTGTYSDSKLKVELKSAGDAYDGTFTLAGQAYPVKASPSAQPGRLTGSFTAGGNAFPFTATLDGDTLTLVSGTTTYTLKKAAANPLDAGASNPLSH